MKKLLVMCLGLVILLAACGSSRIQGMYSNKDVALSADSDAGRAMLHLKAVQSSNIFGADSQSVQIEGKVNPDKNTITFNMEGNKVTVSYKVKGDKLILEDPRGSTKENLELTKE